jgi:tol-pal system protein YbgF
MTPPIRRSPGPLRFPESSGIASVAAILAVCLAVLTAAPAVRAQDTNVNTLLQRIERLQRDLNTLQRHVYRGEPPPAAAPAASAAPAAGAELSGTQAARIEVRLQQFENELRALTGQVEEQSFRMGKVTERLDRLVADVDERLQVLETGIAGQPAEDGLPEAADAQAPSDQPQWDEGPKVLGTISQGEQAAAAPGDQQAALPQEGTPKGDYDHAFKLLSQTDYQGAERALLAFLERYPGDPLAGNAKYWLGETYYVRGQYAEAAVTFAEGYQTYPESVKAPDNLLKLGKSLAALDQTADACGTFGDLLQRYADAPPIILRQAKSERKRLACP